MMRTTDPRIFAAGDVAEHRGRVHGLWPAAVEQAEVAACGALGEEKAYVGSVPVTILKVVGIELTSMGRFETEPGDEEIVFEDEQAGSLPQARDRRRQDRRRDPARLGTDASPVVTAVKRGYDVRGQLDALRAGRWDGLAELSGTHPLVPAAPANPSSG